MNRMTEEDWEFLRVFTAEYVLFRVWRNGDAQCRLCGRRIRYKPQQLLPKRCDSFALWGKLPGRVKRAISIHMKKHAGLFSLNQRQQFVAALALGAVHWDACADILGLSNTETFTELFKHFPPNPTTRGVI